MNVLSAYMCVYICMYACMHTYTCVPLVYLAHTEVRRGHWMPWGWSYRWFFSPCGFWKLDLGSLQEQPVLRSRLCSILGAVCPASLSGCCCCLFLLGRILLCGLSWSLIHVLPASALGPSCIHAPARQAYSLVLRQGLPTEAWLAWILPCRTCWPQTQSNASSVLGWRGVPSTDTSISVIL